MLEEKIEDVEEEQLEDEAEEVVEDVIEDDPEVTDEDKAESEDEGEIAEPDEEPGLVVSLGDDEDEEEQTPVIRTLREKLKEQSRKIKELEQAENKAAEAVQLGDKPTLEGVDYDSERFESELLAWNERKREIDAQKKSDAEKQEDLEKKYQARLGDYNSEKVSLNAKNFDEAEELVRETLSTAQQSIIVANARKPAILVYALGKNPDMMKELAGQDDLASFAYKLGQIEAGMKVTGMNTKPKPEKRLKGQTPPPQTGSKKLEQLRAEAAKTGDMSKVIAYKRSLRQ